ncbi:MAG: hypothetical protein ACI8ZM_005632 [Crocinitomix sp.]|jgi:hypothetical protein
MSTRVLRINLTNSLYSSIRSEKLYNFNEYFFEETLPDKVGKGGFLQIIADDVHAPDSEDLSKIDPAKWHILTLEVGSKTYHTFISRRLNKDLKGTMKEALVEFVSNKVLKDEKISQMGQKTVKNTLKEVMDSVMTGNLGQEAFRDIFENISERVKVELESDQVTKSLENFFESHNIKIKTEDSSCHFKVKSESHQWSYELVRNVQPSLVVLYSFKELKIDDDLLDMIIGDINSLNLTISNGNFEFDTEKHKIYFKNYLNTSVYDFDLQFEKLFNFNYDSMSAFLSILKERYNGKVS